MTSRASNTHGNAIHRTISSEVMRNVLGSFCSGVVVITSTDGDPVGLTCQSFASLSLDPPLVTFAPARSSRSWPRIRDVGSFCVNILASDQRFISDQFARSGSDKFSGVSWSPSPGGAPLLRGVIAWIDCTLWSEYDGGDHTIAVGSVRDLETYPHRDPLLFHRGGYLDRIAG